jgi:sirohydrochlorin ferrochelatase
VKLGVTVDKTFPVEIAFGMASRRNIQQAVDRLATRGVANIVAIPLFISTHSSVITSTEYLLGQRPEPPPELAVFARMEHGHSGHAAHESKPSADAVSPIKSPIPIRMLGALDDHPLVAEILLSRANTLSKKPENEVVVLVAHGPVSDEANHRWLKTMSALAKQIAGNSKFRRIEYLTVRDDATEPIYSRAAAEFRQTVKKAADENSDVLVVPLLLAFGGIEEGIKKRLEGLSYKMSEHALLPDNRLAHWVLLSVKNAKGKQDLVK